LALNTGEESVTCTYEHKSTQKTIDQKQSTLVGHHELHASASHSPRNIPLVLLADSCTHTETEEKEKKASVERRIEGREIFMHEKEIKKGFDVNIQHFFKREYLLLFCCCCCTFTALDINHLG
jgi:hypothetical protein